MGIELELKHIAQWSLDRLLDAPAAVEAFFLAEPRRFPQTALDGLEALGLPALSDQARELAGHDWRSAGLEHLKRVYPVDYDRIRPHLERLFAEWDEPALDLDRAWRRLRDA